MNNLTGNRESSYRKFSHTPFCSEHDVINRVILRETPEADINARYAFGPKPMEILADAKYIFCDNASQNQIEIDGRGVFQLMELYEVNLFIPSVLARCTIIPL